MGYGRCSRSLPITLVAIAGLLLSLSQNALAQAVSFGQITRAETCAENAAKLVGLTGHALTIKIRTSVAGWRNFNGTEDELLRAFLNANPCMKVQIAQERCPDVQALVDTTTVGDSLGAKLKIIFPAETTDMRERWAETFIKAFCPTLNDKAAPPVTGSPSKTGPISFFVDVPTDASGFVSPSMVGVRQNANEITAALLKRHGKAERLEQARNKEVADVVVTVTGREATSDHRVIHVRVVVQGNTFDIDGTAEDDWEAAASDAGGRVADWINENRERIAQGRRDRRE